MDNKKSICEELGVRHKFVFLRSEKSRDPGPFQDLYRRSDKFFCEACLSVKEIVQEESSRGEPAWYRS